jgi:hypothetical protein
MFMGASWIARLFGSRLSSLPDHFHIFSLGMQSVIAQFVGGQLVLYWSFFRPVFKIRLIEQMDSFSERRTRSIARRESGRIENDAVGSQRRPASAAASRTLGPRAQWSSVSVHAAGRLHVRRWRQKVAAASRRS